MTYLVDNLRDFGFILVLLVGLSNGICVLLLAMIMSVPAASADRGAENEVDLHQRC